jgi:hypothetical protein
MDIEQSARQAIQILEEERNPGGAPLHVGMISWAEGDEISERYANQLADLGHTPHLILANSPLPPGLDAILAWGPLGSLVPIARQLLEMEAAHRPAFGLLLTEQLPNPSLPEWWRYRVGMLRSWIERRATRKTGDTWQAAPALSWLTFRLKRYRYYGDLFWLQRKDLLDALAVWSGWNAAFLRERGLDAFVPQRMRDLSWGRDLHLERDIPVLWLGKPGSKRRKKLLGRIRRQLRERGVEMMVVDGVEHPYVFREERTILLNRTRIVLNLLRQKWDDNAMRFELAAYNKAMIVSEPMLPHTPYRPGVHLIEAPIDEIPDVICHFLQDEAARRAIADQAYEFVMSGATKSQVMAELLQRALASRQTKYPTHPD